MSAAIAATTLAEPLTHSLPDFYPLSLAPLVAHFSPALHPTLLLQSLTFAVMPGNDGTAAAESDDFFTYVTTEYPDTAAHWIGYDSESDFADVMSHKDYSRDPTDDRPAFSAGIVFISGSPDWEYTVGVDAAVQFWAGREGDGEVRDFWGGKEKINCCIAGAPGPKRKHSGVASLLCV